MVKLIVKPFVMISIPLEELTALRENQTLTTIPIERYPFTPITVIKAYRTYIHKVPVDPFNNTDYTTIDPKRQELVKDLIDRLLVIPRNGTSSIIYEGTNYKGAIAFYKETKALGYPVELEGLGEAVNVLYGK